MKHYCHFFITAYFLINAVSCNGMNESCHAKSKESKILAEITAIKNPRQGTFLTNKDIVIHGKNGCSIFDINTKSEIIISSIKNNYLAVHPQRKKLALSLTSGHEVTLYNAETGAEESTIQNDTMIITHSTFNPLDETILLWSGFCPTLLRYNYQTECFDVPLQGINQPKAMAFHPTQRRLMCGTYGAVDIYKYEQGGNFIFAAAAIVTTTFCEYSPDGSFIAGGNERAIYTITSAFRAGHKLEILPDQGKAGYLYMKFHPNSSVLATLSAPDDIVRYWDVKKNVLIDVTQSVSCHYQDYCADINPCNPLMQRYQLSSPHLSFSPNGKMLAITLKHKCIVIPVPFEVIYPSITPEKALFIYWLLQHDKDNQYNCFPNEIRQLFMDTLLKTCKR